MTHLIELYGAMLVKAIFVHLAYVLVSVAAATVVALLLGVLLSRAPRIAGLVMPVISIFQTIPGIVFIGILYLYLGMVPVTAFTALAIYAIFPILKNTYAGLLGVEEKYKEAARGCGMNARQILFKVELPLAMPTIFAGIRMSTVYTVSWAVLTAMIGLGGLGEFVYRGVSTNNSTLTVIGAVPAALMAIGLGALIDLIQKKVTPRGLQEVKN
ncbi:ABC transporter permease [Anaerofilum sp. BX8]|uniref:ABC transporter permease n=1 Tax=Anaerofilum hominis TaxID=2763016 RepID=A0A923I7S5_9FIRM|nr:ABC transporter permease [Anaerofilum hominis]MBC5581860.1 ABC transporter permease [Anaerofilum hominis]